MRKVETLFSNMSPLCFLLSGKLVCYKDGRILILLDDKIELSYSIPISWKEIFFGKSKFLFRLLRLGIRAAEAIDENHIIYSIGNMIFEFDLITGEVSNGYLCGNGVRPLSFTIVKDIEGFSDGIYFGGYLSNMDKNPVHIYKRTGVDKWDIVYTFESGLINHVHTILPDPYRSCLWIFTGDFDKSAAIWKVSENFNKVECFADNSQKYRGCVAFALPEGLMYATDAPFADNFIYLLDPSTKKLTPLNQIAGSCIYGSKWNNNYVFSSTVEGDGRNTSRFQFYFGRRRGAGIKDDYIHLYCGNIENGFKEIYKEKKDKLPLYTFQFGVFKFPYGVNNAGSLYFQPIATRNHDLSLLKISK